MPGDNRPMNGLLLPASSCDINASVREDTIRFPACTGRHSDWIEISNGTFPERTLHRSAAFAGGDTYVLCEINVSSVFAIPDEAPAVIARYTLERLRMG